MALTTSLTTSLKTSLTKMVTTRNPPPRRRNCTQMAMSRLPHRSADAVAGAPRQMSVPLAEGVGEAVEAVEAGVVVVVLAVVVVVVVAAALAVQVAL
jgi:hypothetical protein